MDKQELQQYVDSLGLTYIAAFIPQSRSRNKGKDPCLNWSVTIKKGSASITADYTQGVGHIPYYAWRYAKLQCYDAAVREACESGKSRLVGGKSNAWDASHGARVITLRPPCLLDVLYALVTDAEVLNYTCFEDWAESFGYDTDSRKAEKIYKDCLRIALQLQQIINIEEAAELFSDY